MKKEGISLLIVILLIGFVGASFVLEDYDIDLKGYSSQNFIKGYIIGNFTDEPSNSLFETSVGDSIDLLKLLKLNDVDYDCVPSDCESDYKIEGVGKESLSFNLGARKSKVMGIKFTGEIQSINSIDFFVQSNAVESCENQLKIDLLNDGVIDLGNDKISSDSCTSSKDYNCFELTKETKKYSVGVTPYCQEINLSESPGFKVGAWVKKSGSEDLTMTIYDKDINKKGECELPDASETGGEISCDINYGVMKEEEHYVCINADDSSDYEIEGNSNPSTKCGFFGKPIKEATAAYRIFAIGKKFDAVGSLKIDDLLESGENLGGLSDDYIFDKYDKDCSSGCIVPIKFISEYGQSQSITISVLKAKYQEISGGATEENFYEISEIPAKITSESQKLELIGAEFSVTKNMSESGNKTFVLNFSNEEVFSEKIFIEKTSTIESLTPLVAAAAYPTKFVVGVNEQNNSKIVKYIWEFGDDKSLTTTTNETTHTYDEIKDYSLKVTIKDENNLESYKIFNVSVGSPKNIVDREIKKKIRYVENLKSDMEDFSESYKEKVKIILDLNKSEENLKTLESNYESAAEDNDYIIIMKEVIKLNIPRSVILFEQIDSKPFYPIEDNINLEVLKRIDEGSYESNKEGEYITAINNWMLLNTEIDITYEEIIGDYEQQEDKVILKIFELDIKGDGDYYIILENLEGLEFDKGSPEQEGDYVYISAKEDKNIKFSITEDVSFIDLPFFVSPAISELSVSKEIDDKKTSSWSIVWIMILLFLIGLVGYIVLQEWYKRRYESHLFKSRNSLYNIVQYVHHAKEKGDEEKKIKKNLKKAGWTGEQVRYATKKYAGKRTGMANIPNPFAKKTKTNKKRNSGKDILQHRKFNK